MKSDKPSNNLPNPTTLYFEGKTITNKEEFGHIFNRVINNLMNFAKKIITLPRAPSILAALCRSSNTINIAPTNTRKTRPDTITFNETEKFSDLIFSYFFNKLINSFYEYDFYKKNDFEKFGHYF